MNFNKQVKSELSETELIALIIAFLEIHKFKLHNQENSKLIFKRGSLLKNMVTFNPLNWKSNVSIIINSSVVNYDWQIDSTFQAVTKQEETVWESFIRSFNKTIKSGKLSNKDTIEALKSNRKSIAGYLLYAILGGIIIGIPSGVIAYLTDIDSIASIGAASGAIAFLYWKIEKEKIKNKDGS